MRLGWNRWRFMLFAAVLFGVPCEAAAGAADADAGVPDAEPSPPAPEPAANPKLDEAKRLFEQGNALRRSGEWQRALDLFLESRRLVPSVPNTINAAVCLEQLARFDEALDLYESILVNLAAQIDDAMRARLQPKLDGLRKKIGLLELSANVTGKVVVDGRERGSLPLRGPLRVLPGRRQVRVLQDGYAAFERTVEVTAGQTARLDARLEPLAASGRLRVEVAGAEAAEVRVNGVTVGSAPWEGTLAPGRHRYEVLDHDRGSGPVTAVVLQGQTILARPTLQALGPELRLRVEPPSAELDADGIALGKGSWQGRLTRGRHVLGAREPGYETVRREVSVSAESPRSLQLSLRLVPEHPRWGAGARSEAWLDAFAAVAFAPSIGSGAEQSCDAGRCSSRGTPLGFLGGARVGWDLPIGLSLEAAAGYALLQTSLERTDDVAFGARTAHYRYRDEIHVGGPIVSGGAGYALDLGKRLSLRGRVHLGAWLVGARDVASAEVSDGITTAEAPVAGVSETTRSIALAVLPELALRASFTGWHAGAGVAALLVPGKGATNAQSDASPTQPGTDCSTTPTPVACAQASGLLRGERGYGPLFAIAPGLFVGLTF